MTKHSCKWHLVAYSYKLNGCKYKISSNQKLYFFKIWLNLWFWKTYQMEHIHDINEVMCFENDYE
jgi:hypothetical protein